MLADLLGAGGDDHLARLHVLAGLELDADDAGAVAGEDGGDAGLLEELAHVDDGTGGIAGRDELGVVGEGALDEGGHHLHGLEAEQHLGASSVEGQLHGLFFLRHEAHHLPHGAGGDDHLDLLRHILVEGELVDGEAEAVGGGEGDLGAVKDGVDAGKDGARVVGGSGELHVFDSGAQGLGVELEAEAIVHARHGRKVGGVHAGDGGLVAGAAQGQLPRARRHRQVDALAGEGGDEVGQQTSGDGDGTLLLHLGADPAGDGDLQVGGDELEAALVAGEKDVRGLRESAAGSHGPAHDGQTLGEVFLERGYLHSVTYLIVYTNWGARSHSSIRPASRTDNIPRRV